MQGNPGFHPVFPAKMAPTSLNLGVFQGKKTGVLSEPTDRAAQIAQENVASGNVPVRLLDNAGWLLQELFPGQ